MKHTLHLLALAALGIVARPINAARRVAVGGFYKVAGLFVPARDPGDKDSDGQPG